MSKNSKEQNERNSKILMDLLKISENKECSECTAKGPRWASANLGVFMCLRCSGIHRNLGTHISFVRSVTLDTWNPEHVKNMQRIGNAKAKQIWEACLPPGVHKPDENDDVRVVEKWIRDKYVKQLYKSKDGQPPADDEEVEQPRKREGKRNGRHRHGSDDEAEVETKPIERPVRQPEPRHSTTARSPLPTSTTSAQQTTPRQLAAPQASSSTASLIDFDLGLSTTGSSSQPPIRPASAPASSHGHPAPSPRAYSQPQQQQQQQQQPHYAQPQQQQAQPVGDLLMQAQPEAANNQMKDSIMSLFQQPAPTPYRAGAGAGYPAAPAYAGYPPQGYQMRQAPQPQQPYYGAPPAPATGYAYGYNNYQQPR